jgi:hypothetical protein
MDNFFQRCGSCGKKWPTWQEFVLDEDVRLLGFQAATGLADANLIVFEHRCGSSISVLASRLRHLRPTEPEANLPRLYGTEQCNGHCRELENLEACDRSCVNAGDRDIVIQLIRMKRADF